MVTGWNSAASAESACSVGSSGADRAGDAACSCCKKLQKSFPPISACMVHNFQPALYPAFPGSRPLGIPRQAFYKFLIPGTAADPNATRLLNIPVHRLRMAEQV